MIRTTKAAAFSSWPLVRGAAGALMMLVMPVAITGIGIAGEPGGPFLQIAAAAAGFTASSLEEATREVRRRTGGRVLSARTVTGNGPEQYHIKVLTPDHKVRVFRVDSSRR